MLDKPIDLQSVYKHPTGFFNTGIRKMKTFFPTSNLEYSVYGESFVASVRFFRWTHMVSAHNQSMLIRSVVTIEYHVKGESR